MDLDIFYYNENVQELINDWPIGIRAYYARVTERMVTFGPNLGMPFTRSMGNGLFEIRAKGKEGIGRAFFCIVVDQRIIILHGFVKKTQKTPKKELAIAQRRMKEVKANW
jgi:phage-related protein